MWPWILGSAGLGALTSGIRGYQQSGGDLGATTRAALSGGALGAVTGGIGSAAGGLAASRMAGAIPLAMLAKKQAMGLGLTGVEKAMMAAPGLAGGAANIGTQLAANAVLSPLAAAAGNLGGQAIGGTAKAARAALGFGTKEAPGTGAYPTGAVPGLNDPLFGNRVLGGNVMDVYDVAGPLAASRAAQLLQGQIELENLKRIEPYKAQMIEGRSKAEFQRNMAAAALRQNIATQAALLQGGIGAAQQMGLQASQDIGRGLTQQYQYS